MVYETNCKRCGVAMKIPVNEEDDKACREMGINPDKWMGTLICKRCSYYRDTGKRPPLSSNVRDFLMGGGDEGA